MKQVMLDEELCKSGYDIACLDSGRKMVLITGHRHVNFGEGFISIYRSIKRLSEKFTDVDFIYPMHLNPNVRHPIHEVFGENLSD